MKFSIPDFKKNSILVVGDIILDNYWYGSVEKISKEVPIPTINIKDKQSELGGAANVAANIAKLGAKVFLVGIIGKDRSSEIINKKLIELNISFDPIVHSSYQTVTKFRVLSRDYQLARIDFEDEIGENSLRSLDVLKRIRKSIPFVQAVVLSDYGKGTLREASKIINFVKDYRIPILVDPYGKDFMRYKMSTVLTPNLEEFESVVGKCSNDSEIEEKGFDMIDTLSLKGILITRSEKGMLLLYDKDRKFYLPSFAKKVRNVAGAGDTVIAVLSASLSSSKLSLDQCCFLSNVAASIAVEKKSTSRVSIRELKERIYSRRRSRNFGIIHKDQMKETLNICKILNEKIVMIDGFFDEIHFSCIRFLDKARSLGDRLIVAINSDISVEKLAMKSSIVYSLEERMEVLSKLKSVDWIIPFDEKTPEDLVREIKPDIFVKTDDRYLRDISWINNILCDVGEVRVI